MTRPNPSPRRWAKQLDAARNAADDQRFNIGHAAALAEMLGVALTENHCLPDDDDETVGLRVEYIARQIKQHVNDLGDALRKIERIEMAMKGRAPVEPDQSEGGNVVHLAPPNPDGAA